MQERLAIAGAGTIACGLAATAASHAEGEVVLWARSDASAERAQASVAKLCDKLGSPDAAARVTIATDQEALHGETFIVEAVVEDPEHKSQLLAELGAASDPEAILATTTSSLSIESLAQASGRPDRFLGLHVFNPVPRMELVELVFPAEATRTSASAPGSCARRWARPRSRSPTPRALSSTGCCSPTCSTRSS